MAGKNRILPELKRLEIIRPLPRKIQITHAVFDHDGTISVLRRGWDKAMLRMMTKSIIGKLNVEKESKVVSLVRKNVFLFINRSAGWPTLLQMEHLVQLIRKYKFVPSRQILSAIEYKKIYLQQFQKRVEKRMISLKNGILKSSSFLVRGVFPFLNVLKSAGIKLFLTSGTDQKIVETEARLLGYLNFFKNQIHGASSSGRTDSKALLLEELRLEIGKSYTYRLLTFGDGPVEIRETRKQGGLTVGIASDEQRGGGWDLNKRNRLKTAGAHILVPDFSQYKNLCGVLRIDY